MRRLERLSLIYPEPCIAIKRKGMNMTDTKTMDKKSLALRVQSLENTISEHLEYLDQITSMILILRDSLEGLDAHTYNQRLMLSNINLNLLNQFFQIADLLDSTKKESE